MTAVRFTGQTLVENRPVTDLAVPYPEPQIEGEPALLPGDVMGLVVFTPEDPDATVIGPSGWTRRDQWFYRICDGSELWPAMIHTISATRIQAALGVFRAPFPVGSVVESDGRWIAVEATEQQKDQGEGQTTDHEHGIHVRWPAMASGADAEPEKLVCKPRRRFLPRWLRRCRCSKPSGWHQRSCPRWSQWLGLRGM